jgi:hypothetical protein
MGRRVVVWNARSLESVETNVSGGKTAQQVPGDWEIPWDNRRC